MKGLEPPIMAESIERLTEGKSDDLKKCRLLRSSARQPSLRLLYGIKAQTKGKIEGLFRFVQRDFVLENVHLSPLKDVNEAFWRWLDDYNSNLEHEGINLTVECGVNVLPAMPLEKSAMQMSLKTSLRRKLSIR